MKQILLTLVFLEGLLPTATPQTEYRVPYRYTESSHIVVRAKINGEGPFNFLLDSGAPCVWISPNVAQYLGISVPQNGWVQIRSFQVEGGPTIQNLEVRFAPMMQVDGMNKRGIPGLRLDGAIGYHVMARFRIEIDLTRPYLTWTKLDFNPPVNFGTNPRPVAVTVQPPAQFVAPQRRNPNAALGDLRDKPFPPAPGLLGVEFDPDVPPLKISAVLKGSPAEKAGLKAGDVLLEFSSRPVQFPEDVARLSGAVAAGSTVALKIQRGNQTLNITVTAAAGL
jgi:membrane-associated protease RseP (regulator of RpoE activity)